MLLDITYLDHAGTTLYASSLIKSVSEDLLSNLYGNPHSQSSSSQLTTQRILDIRLHVLRLFNADPEDYDVVFCSNATAGVKLILEAYSAQDGGFQYRYHKDCHTSLVGVRELAEQAECLGSDEEVVNWLEEEEEESNEEAGGQQTKGLFAYPGQSNFSGRRLPLRWPQALRHSRKDYYSLLDAAALVTTATLDLNEVAPDFTVLSFYKMFGYPDLGALIVRKTSPGMQEFLSSRRYFGGGTVAAVSAQDQKFHAKRSGAPHVYLEDGTLPFHSILALGQAMLAHEKLYGSFMRISSHATALVRQLSKSLQKMEHFNGRKTCVMYSESFQNGDNLLPNQEWAQKQGPVLTFNLRRGDGSWVGHSEFEKLATVKKIHIRTGGLCNPGGVESYIGLKPWEIRENYEAGHRCWDDKDVMRGKPTGAIRVSLGAMSTAEDISKFLAFVEEFYVEKARNGLSKDIVRGSWGGRATAVVESITICWYMSLAFSAFNADISWFRSYQVLWWFQNSYWSQLGYQTIWVFLGQRMVFSPPGKWFGHESKSVSYP